jgi:hypothetical protein
MLFSYCFKKLLLVALLLLQEREAVMLGVIDQVCSKGLAVAPGAPQPSVALVVGSAHLPGETAIAAAVAAAAAAAVAPGAPQPSVALVMGSAHLPGEGWEVREQQQQQQQRQQ